MEIKLTLVRMFGSGQIGPIQSMLNNYRSVSLLHSIQSVVVKGLGGTVKNRFDMSETHKELHDLIAPPEKTLYQKLHELRGKWYGHS